MHIFITGIAGFIGFHIAQALRKRGDTVVGCDNFNAYYDPQLKRDRAAILEKVGIKVFEADICDGALLEKLVVENKITHFLHLAAQAGVRHSIKQPQDYVASNLDGFIKVVEVIRHHPEIPLVYASSSSVYGLNKKIPFSETDQIDLPSSLYGATKKSNELIAHAYHHMFGISVTGLRFFTVYGPWGRPDMAYFSFTDAILKGKPLQIFNEGQMKRDFTYIDDIVAGTIAAIDLAAPCEIFNLGNHKPEGVLHLVEILENHLGKNAVKNFLPMQLSEVPVTYADISKSQKVLGFSPKISLETGIEKFLAWYREYYP
ncbi:MAG TPA: NAD-dependent epimerase/dehydratase family protein [Rhabdochlamydiaceae bacterium]|nr:NAD-dependent epimerase/dehydratase family protein [Rhabdochlamydiaceae bacterium]